MDRRKELKEQYKQMKPEMGVFMIRSLSGGKCYLEAAKDLKGKMNRTKFQLGFHSFPIKELQKDWDTFGEAGFEFKVAEALEYDKDESKTDYSEELSLLKMMWEEKLVKENTKLY